MFRLFANLTAIAALSLAATTARAQQHGHKVAKSDSAAAKAAQGKGQEGGMSQHGMMDHDMSPWKELGAFHTLLAATYHPAAEKGDLAPLKAKASELAASAAALNGSTPPTACATPEIKTAVDSLGSSSASLAEQVRNQAADSVLKRAIGAIHAQFESVQKGCGTMKGMKH